MRYTIKVLTADQRIDVVDIDAPDAPSAQQYIDRAHGQVLSVRRASPLQGLFTPRAAAPFPLLSFTQELVTLLSAGFNLTEAIATLAAHAPANEVGRTLRTLDQSLAQGLRCSAAMATVPSAFPAFYLATVRASEASGDVESALRRYLTYAEQADTLRQRVTTALLYPALLLFVSALVLVFLLSYVVPKFSLVYSDLGGELPFATRVLMALGDAVREHGLLLVIIVVAVLGIAATAPVRERLKRAAVRALLTIPALRDQTQTFYMTRLFRVLSLLTQSGTPFVAALESALDLLPDHLRQRAHRALGEVRSGRSVADALAAQGLTSGITQRLIHVGERSGRLADMLIKAAERDEQVLARQIEWLTKLLAPVLIAVLGIVIGGIVVFLYLPIFQLAEGLQ